MARDPICGKEVDPLRARAVGIFGGVTYYFCSPECKSKYVDPRRAPRPPEPQAAPEPPRKIDTKEPSRKIEAKEPSRKIETPPRKIETPPPRKDPSLELPPLPQAQLVAHDDDELPEPTPSAPHRTPSSPSVIEEVREMKSGSRRWAVIIVILAALVVAAAVLSLRN